MKGLPDRLYTPKHVVISRIVFFIVLYFFTFNILGYAQTHHRSLKQISGEIILQEGEELSKHARIVIQLLDVSVADTAAVKLSEAIIEDVNEIPIPFTMRYDADLIKPSHRYAVAVDIYERQENGLFRRVFRNTQHYPVITGDGAEYVQIMVQRL
jgi:putative lipoprotein